MLESLTAPVFMTLSTLAASPTGGAVPLSPGGGAGNGGGGAGGAGAGSGGGAGGMPGLLLIMMVFVGFMIVMSIVSGRKEKKRRAEMLSSLGRHDRVRTSGGLIGTIVELKEGEVVLKVDEASNTRIHFALDAVTAVLKSARKPDEPETIDSVGG